MNGYRKVLSLWSQGADGVESWLTVLTELRSHGIQGMLIACCDELNGSPEAIDSVFSKIAIYTCIVHMIRNSAHHVSRKGRMVIVRSLKPTFPASTREEAEAALIEFEAEWGERKPVIVKF